MPEVLLNATIIGVFYTAVEAAEECEALRSAEEKLWSRYSDPFVIDHEVKFVRREGDKCVYSVTLNFEFHVLTKGEDEPSAHSALDEAVGGSNSFPIVMAVNTYRRGDG